jgi:hypothetical protein
VLDTFEFGSKKYGKKRATALLEHLNAHLLFDHHHDTMPYIAKQGRWRALGQCLAKLMLIPKTELQAYNWLTSTVAF